MKDFLDKVFRLMLWSLLLMIAYIGGSVGLFIVAALLGLVCGFKIAQEHIRRKESFDKIQERLTEYDMESKDDLEGLVNSIRVIVANTPETVKPE